MVERYINPHTDFGFYRLFGSESNKDLLKSFLNAIFHDEQNVQDVTYLNSEQFDDHIDACRAVFDVYCENDRGEKFIVEMQNVYQEFFKDRTIYYSTFPIREQAQRGGDWDFHLNSVYTIGLLN
ncbi:MAG: Rpn family recombination-promoting nuclease/putative transposase, partial [Prevotella sp.]|nr:Rpn family recombination-promoting nuclease/putative transposase [Prevotella sp.]